METDKERLEESKKFVSELLKKSKYYNWSVDAVLCAVKKALELGLYSLPKDVPNAK